MKNNKTALKKLGTALAYAAAPVLLLGSGTFMITYGCQQYETLMAEYKTTEEYKVHEQIAQDRINNLEALLDKTDEATIRNTIEEQIKTLKSLPNSEDYLNKCFLFDHPDRKKELNKIIALQGSGAAALGIGIGSPLLELGLYREGVFKRRREDDGETPKRILTYFGEDEVM